MFQLGSITGLFSAQIETVQQTSKSVGEVVDDMAKTSKDVPMSILAPMKSLAVAAGCFSKAVVTKVTTEEDEKAVAAAAASEAAAAAAATATDAAEAAAAAAATASAVAAESGNGAKTPTVSTESISLNAFNKKTTLGGRMDKSRDPRSGSNIAHMPVAKNPEDVVRSAYRAAQRENLRAEQAFKREFCDKMPYPECVMCPYATRTMYVESDLDKLLGQLEAIIGLLVKGLYSLSAGLFKCPGQLRAMLTGNYFPFGEVVVASAMSTLANLVAVRGAIEHFEGLVAAVRYTDFRTELMRNVKDLFKSGALIGMPKAFTKEIGRLLKDIGCSANNISKMVSGKTPSKGTKYGPKFSVYGDKSYNNKIISGYYRTVERRAPSPESTAKAEAALKSVSSSMKSAAAIAENPSIVANNPSVANPTSTTKNYNISSDITAKENSEYFVANPNSTNESDKYLPLKDVVGKDIPVGSDLSTYIAIYGDLFVIEDNGVSSPDPVPTTDTVAVAGKIYYIKDPITGKFIPVTFDVGSNLVFNSVADLTPELIALAKKLGIPLEEFVKLLKNMYSAADTSGSGESYMEVDETTPIAGKEYYVVDTDPKSTTVGQFVSLDVTSGTFPDGTTVYVKTDVPYGTEKGATPFTGSGACVLDTGIVIAEPVFLDAESHRMAIDTKTLITVTGVLAGDMATIEGIGLSPYEIKMAYLLDHLRNGSIMPDDVNAEHVSTILDNICDE